MGIDDSAGFHTIAVDSHGKAFAFGNGRSGRLGVGHVANCLTPTPLAVPAVAAVAASLTFSVFALADGTLWHTGDCETLGEALPRTLSPAPMPRAWIEPLCTGSGADTRIVCPNRQPSARLGAHGLERTPFFRACLLAFATDAAHDSVTHWAASKP